MFVVMNVFHVPDEKGREKMKEMFGSSTENMREVPGCLEFQFLESEKEEKQIVYTKWKDKAAFKAWTESEAFRKAHANQRTEGSPAASSQIETYEVVHSTDA